MADGFFLSTVPRGPSCGVRNYYELAWGRVSFPIMLTPVILLLMHEYCCAFSVVSCFHVLNELLAYFLLLIHHEWVDVTEHSSRNTGSSIRVTAINSNQKMRNSELLRGMYVRTHVVRVRSLQQEQYFLLP